MRKARERELSRRRLLLSFDGENGIASGVRQRARAEVGHRQRESRESATLVLLPVAPASHARPAEEFLLVAWSLAYVCTTLPQVILPGTLFATFPRAHDLAHTSVRARVHLAAATDLQLLLHGYSKLTTTHESCMA